MRAASPAARTHSRCVRHVICLLVCMTLILTSARVTVASTSEDTTLLQIDYGSGASNVVDVRLENARVLDDGSIVANIIVENLKAVTYDMTMSAHGNVTLDPLNVVETDFFPLMARRPWPAESGSAAVVFEPGSTLTVRFDKFGYSASDGLALLTLDLCSMITLFSLGEFAPTVPKDMVPGIRDSIIGLLENAGFDTALFSFELLQEDPWGAAQQLGDVITDIPGVFADWIAENLGVIVSKETVKRVGKWMRAVPVIPVVWDLIAAPRHVELTITSPGTDQGNADVMLAIDNSGSMAGDPISAAREAAKQFVDFMDEGDMVGVVEFNTDAYGVFPLTSIVGDGTTRTAAKQAIDGITTTGQTSIGDGLRSALNQIAASGSPDRVHSIILLSDGEENEPEYVDTVLPDLISAGVAVHTVALGDSANTTLLSDIAAQTGGAFAYSSAPEDLSEIYNLLITDVSNFGTLSENTGFVGQGDTVAHPTELDTSVLNPMFSLTWPGSDLDLTLRSPGGTVIDPVAAGNTPEIRYVEGPTYEYYSLDESVEVGNWTAEITGIDTGGVQESYRLSVRAQTNIRAEASVPAANIQPGTKLPLTTYVYDNSGGIPGASVVATVADPAGGTATLQLAADDNDRAGYYGGVLTDTVTYGRHEIRVTADGVSNEGQSFSRVARTAYVVEDVAQPEANTWISILGETEVDADTTEEYTLLFGNSGPQRAIDVGIGVELPPSATVVSSSLGDLTTLPDDGGPGWTVDDLALGAVTTATLRVHLLGSAGVSGTAPIGVRIAAGLDGSGSTMLDPYPANNTDLIEIQMPRWQVYLPMVQRYSAAVDPLTPTLLEPVDGSILNTLIPVYRWDNGTDPDATEARVQVATDAGFTQPVATLWAATSPGVHEFQFPLNLEPGTTYYWRAWFIHDDVVGPYSETWSFTTGSSGTRLPAPDLIAPADGTSPAAVPVLLDWAPVSGADRYLVRYREKDYAGFTYRWIPGTETETSLSWLTADTTYEWWVAAVNDYAIGVESPTWQFTTSSSSATLLQGYENPDPVVETGGHIDVVREPSSH